MKCLKITDLTEQESWYTSSTLGSQHLDPTHKYHVEEVDYEGELMSYWTNKLTEQSSLIGRPCWYKKPYRHELTFAQIKEVDVKVTAKGKQVTAILDNGEIAVLHNYDCPDYIGSYRVWGFLTRAECEEYWDM